MKKLLKKSITFSFTTLAAAASLGVSTPAAAQISGGIHGIEDAPGFDVDWGGARVVTLNGDFQIGAPEVHRFIINQILFGGDGRDYLVGSDAADSLISDSGEHDPFKSKFDGGDGPDYLVGDAGDHDPFKPKFDGGDGPDFLVGSDAADSLIGSDTADSFEDWDSPMDVPFHPQRVRIAIELASDDQQLPGLQGFTNDLHMLLTFAFDSMAIQVPIDGLNSTGNEVAVFENQGVSLNSTGNEVAIRSIDDRSVTQRWTDWISFESLWVEKGTRINAEADAHDRLVGEGGPDVVGITAVQWPYEAIEGGEANGMTSSQYPFKVASEPIPEQFTQVQFPFELSPKTEPLHGEAGNIVTSVQAPYYLAGELDILLFDLEVGVISGDRFGAELEALIADSLLMAGYIPESVRVTRP
ncbi:MAG: hypothetical protein AAF585_13290 [Verrucomicrobiota bacterium]